MFPARHQATPLLLSPAGLGCRKLRLVASLDYRLRQSRQLPHRCRNRRRQSLHGSARGEEQ